MKAQAPRKAKRRNPGAQQEASAAVRTTRATHDFSCEERLSAFLDQHPSWAQYFSSDDAVYLLPEAFLKAFTQTFSHQRALPPIDDEGERAERAFRKLCEGLGANTVGVCMRRPVVYGLFAQQTPRSVPTEEIAIAAPEHLDDLVNRYLTDPTKEQASHRRQRLAYAGALMFHKPFREELATLKSMWDALPTPKPAKGPWYSCGRAIDELARRPASQPRRGSKVSRENTYYKYYDDFRCRWYLLTLRAWDLPEPSPRWEDEQLGTLVQHYGWSLRVDYCPPYLSAKQQRPARTLDASRRLTAFFEEHATEFGIAAGKATRGHEPASLPWDPELPSVPGIGGQGKGETKLGLALEMWLLETAVKRRYTTSGKVTQRVLGGFASLKRISSERAKTVRAVYRRMLFTSAS